MSSPRELATVIMAAGKGTRMNNPAVAKVMYPILGKPLLGYVVDLAFRLSSETVVVIVGWQKESVIGYLRDQQKPVVCVEQSPQLGTGHAVMQAGQELHEFKGDVLVLSGDVPLLTVETADSLVAHHRNTSATATVLTAIVQDPTGYGRILRNESGSVRAIVEQKDASETERKVNEINSGIYVFDGRQLFEALRHITPSNAQKEYYLTDVFAYFRREGQIVSAIPASDAREIMGINTPEQLEEARRVLSALVDNQK